MPLIINHKNFTMDYRGAYYKAQVETLTVEIFISILYTLYNAGKTTMRMLVHINCYYATL